MSGAFSTQVGDEKFVPFCWKTWWERTLERQRLRRSILFC